MQRTQCTNKQPTAKAQRTGPAPKNCRWTSKVIAKSRTIDAERKRKQNRESAARCRKKQVDYRNQLEEQLNELRIEYAQSLETNKKLKARQEYFKEKLEFTKAASVDLPSMATAKLLDGQELRKTWTHT